MEDQRPDLFDLWKKYHFNVEQVARRAGVEVGCVLAMLRHRKVARSVAQRVLCSVTAFLGKRRTTGHPKKRTTQPIYSLDNVKVPLEEDESQG